MTRLMKYTIKVTNKTFSKHPSLRYIQKLLTLTFHGTVLWSRRTTQSDVGLQGLLAPSLTHAVTLTGTDPHHRGSDPTC